MKAPALEPVKRHRMAPSASAAAQTILEPEPHGMRRVLIATATTGGSGPVPQPYQNRGAPPGISEGAEKEPLSRQSRRERAVTSRGRWLLPLLFLLLALGTQEAQGRKKGGHKRGAGFWSVSGSDFVDSRGNIMRFSGVIWSGFETPEAVVHGLWAHPLTWHLDRMRDLRFNMIRLPFAGDALGYTGHVGGIHDIYPLNPGLKGKSPLEMMDVLVHECGKRGIKVILDYHRIHMTTEAELGTWFDASTPESTWISNWVMLANRYKGNPTIIGVDLFNEVHPNSTFPPGAPYWEPDVGPNEKYNFRSAAKRAIAAIHFVAPDWILFIEGMGNNYWWGGDCIALQKYPLTYPGGKLAFSTHEYGPRVHRMPWVSAADFPRNTEAIYRAHWGGLIEKKVAPVWVGEFGSFYPEPNTAANATESATFEALIEYMRKVGASWTLAFWGPDSRDTGGVLTNDWTTPDARKLKALAPIMHPQFR